MNCPLFHANTARRRAEQDSILLANRIRLLRVEEEKAKKKIRETEQKTKEILEVRHRGEMKRVSKEAEEARREAIEQELRAKANRERQEQQRKTQVAQRDVLREKVQMKLREVQTKEVHRLAIQQEQQEAAAEAQARAAQVRKELAAGERRRARSEGARLEVARANFHEKLAREEESQRDCLDHISRMEKEEADLILRLQRSQERHRLAFAQLEDAIAGGSVGASMPSSRCPSSLDELQDSPQVVVTSSTTSSASRPPRPRIVATSTPTSGSRRSSSSLRRPRSQSPQVGRPSSANHNTVVAKDTCATSICSTSSDGPRPESTGSGRSSPCSQSVQAITYTTVDGLQIDIPPEDDLDLGKLLSGQ